VSYAAGNQVEDEVAAQRDIRFRYISANGAELFFSPERRVGSSLNRFEIPSPHLQCKFPRYNNYRRGLNNLNRYMSELGVERIREQFARREVVYMAGSTDNPPIEKEDARLLWGNTILQFRIIHFNHIKDYFGREILNRQRLVVVPGVAHNHREMFNSRAGITYLFDRDSLWRKAAKTPRPGGNRPTLNHRLETDGRARHLFVNAMAARGGSGKNWSSAYRDLQDALRSAKACPGQITEIWVAAGTYRPDRETGDRSATFQLLNGVRLYGGFAGHETARDERDPTGNVTILSGDLKDDDGHRFANNAENCYQVVTGSGADSTPVLDGFTITGGHADGKCPCNLGAGMYNACGGPTVVCCNFRGNDAEYGGGMYNADNVGATLIDCTFYGNRATASGGGMHCSQSSPTVTNCVFDANTSAGHGGAICTRYTSSPVIKNCVFRANEAVRDGGGISFATGSPSLTDCTFVRNSAGRSGGALLNAVGSPTRIVRCAFTGNSSGRLGGAIGNFQCHPILSDCMFSGNSTRLCLRIR
jgi:predicted outer membrane repeat protein